VQQRRSFYLRSRLAASALRVHSYRSQDDGRHYGSTKVSQVAVQYQVVLVATLTTRLSEVYFKLIRPAGVNYGLSVSSQLHQLPAH